MRAYVIDRFKTPVSLDEVPVPGIGVRDVRVRVTAAGVNPVDWKIRSGAMPDLPLPRVLGQDVAGVVDAVGSDVTRFAVGDRVVGCARTHGGFADLTTLPENSPQEPVSKIPDGVSDAIASALPTPGLTALGCLNAAGVDGGVAVVIIGAGGAVGAIATQLAVMREARVIATVKGGDAAAVSAFRPQQIVESTDPAEIIRAAKAAFPDGVPAVLDFVSDGETLKRYAEVVAKGGTIVTTIHVADVGWFAQHGVRAVNLTMNETPESSPAGLDELTSLVRDGKLTVAVRGERPLEAARELLDQGEQHALHGKYVLRPGGGNGAPR